MGPPCRGSADSREEGGTKDTIGATETRENKVLRGTIGVTTRKPMSAAGGFPGAGDKVNGGEHGESRMVNMARGTAWKGIHTATTITRR